MRPASTELETNVPAFLSKLWKIVNDPETDHLICWSPNGDSFVIQNQAQFWYNLLPIYYKHNNMSSFIRQLNMYGFHKISSESGGIDSEKDEIRFFHPLFQQDKQHLMKFIKRKIANSKSPAGAGDDKVNNVDQITRVLVDVKQLRGRQESVDNQLAAMKQENAALWRELALLRQKHMKQQQIVNKLIHFLVTIVQPSRSGLGGIGVKRRFPLMLNDGRQKVAKTESVSDGPTIHELDPEQALSESLLLNETDAEQTINALDNQTMVNSPPSCTSNLVDSSSVLLNLPIIDDSENSSDNPNLLLPDDESVQDTNVTASVNESDSVTNLFDQTDLNSPNNDTFSMKDKDLQDVINNKEFLQTDSEYIELSALKNEAMYEDPKSRILLNPNMQDAMISNLVADISNKGKSNDDNVETTEKKSASKNDMTVATRTNSKDLNNFKVNIADDLDSHLESTQDELDTIKEMLFDGYSLDANALLGNEVNYRYDAVPLQLFNPDDNFSLDVPQITIPEENKNSGNSDYDPMLSGSALATYNNTPFLLDFENLFEDNTSDTVIDNVESTLNVSGLTDEINTPVAVKKEPSFPTVSKSNAQ